MNREMIGIELLLSFFIFEILIIKKSDKKWRFDFYLNFNQFLLIVAFLIPEMLNFMIFVIWKESEGLSLNSKVTGNP
jgi:hypothetical protein